MQHSSETITLTTEYTTLECSHVFSLVVVIPSFLSFHTMTATRAHTKETTLEEVMHMESLQASLQL